MYFSLINIKLLFHHSIFVILLIFFQTNSVFSQESNGNCMELIKPKDINELKELTICIKKINTAKETEKEKQIIQNSLEGSNKLTERIVKAKKLAKFDVK